MHNLRDLTRRPGFERGARPIRKMQPAEAALQPEIVENYYKIITMSAKEISRQFSDAIHQIIAAVKERNECVLNYKKMSKETFEKIIDEKYHTRQELYEQLTAAGLHIGILSKRVPCDYNWTGEEFIYTDIIVYENMFGSGIFTEKNGWRAYENGMPGQAAYKL